MGGELLLRVTGVSAPEAVRLADSYRGSVAGYAVDIDLSARPGIPIVGAFARVGKVMTLWGIHGDETTVALAVERTAEFGASWIAVQGIAGPKVVATAVAAAAGRGASIALWTLPPDVDTTTMARLGLGSSRGSVVSRIAKSGSEAGVSAVFCSLSDLGVVAQAAPSMTRVAVGIESPHDLAEAETRGAHLIVVPVHLLADR